MSHAPPLPRKPASYSPSFLARADYEAPELALDHEHPSYYGTHHELYDGPYHEPYNEPYNDHDRDFALDQCYDDAGISRSRPTSQDSAYGRPLPAPPPVQRPSVRMPEPDSSFAYDELLSDYEYDTRSRSYSQTRLGTYPIFDGASPYDRRSSQRSLPRPPQDDYPEFRNVQNSHDQQYYPSRFESPIRIYHHNDDPRLLEDDHLATPASLRRNGRYLEQSHADQYHPEVRIPSPTTDQNCPEMGIDSSRNSVHDFRKTYSSSVQYKYHTGHTEDQPSELPVSKGPSRHVETHLRTLSHDVGQLEISARQHATEYTRGLRGDSNSFGQAPTDNTPYTADYTATRLQTRYEKQKDDLSSRGRHANGFHPINPFEHVRPGSAILRRSASDSSEPEQAIDHSITHSVATDMNPVASRMEYFMNSDENEASGQPCLLQDIASKMKYNQTSERSPGWSQTLPNIRQKSTNTPRPRRDFSRSHTVSERVPVRDPLPHSLTNTPTQISSLLPMISKSTRKLASADYDSCRDVWSRRALFSWLKMINASTEDEVVQSCVGLFTHNVPTLSNSLARNIADSILQSFISQNEILPISETTKAIKLASEAGDGVLPTFSNAGCYSSRCHSNIDETRCYSSRCSRTIPVRHQRPELSRVIDANDWAQFWGLQMDQEPLKSLDKREVQRQYQIHEVIYSESDYIKDLKVLRDVFQNNLIAADNEDHEFIDLVFGEIPRLLTLAEDELEKDLKVRQAEQGPVITNIGDIFLSWIRSAGPVYVNYAARMGYADRAVRSRKIRSPVIREWLAACESDPRAKKLGFSSFHGSPTRRMQRYALLLGDVLKRTPEGSVDYNLLTDAIGEIKKVCIQCNTEVQLSQDKIALSDLGQGLNWQVARKDLNLNDPCRELRHRGTLQRKSESHTSWQLRELILLDNFFLCLKPSKDGAQKVVSRNPIPVDFLVVDDHDEILSKSSSSKILGGTITHTISSIEQQQGRRSTFESSTSTVKPPDGSASPSKSASETLFPFSVRHAGRPEEKMTFYAESPTVRSAWITAMQVAKAARWSKVANREPFKIQVLANETFGTYNPHRGNTLDMPTISNTVEAVLSQQAMTGEKVLSRARVCCSTIFAQDNKREVYILGTDDGIYCNDNGTWTQIIAVPRVTQVAVLEEFGVLTVLSDKMLIAYNLEDILSAKTNSSSRKVPQKLSGKQNVGFFEVGLLKGRMLVIYKKRDNSNSVFKALEPVIGRKQEKKTFFKRGNSASSTDFFRDFDVSAAQLTRIELMIIAILYPHGMLWHAIFTDDDLYKMFSWLRSHVVGLEAARHDSRSVQLSDGVPEKPHQRSKTTWNL